MHNINAYIVGTRRVARWLRACNAFAEGPVSFSTPILGVPKPPLTSVSGRAGVSVSSSTHKHRPMYRSLCPTPHN